MITFHISLHTLRSHNQDDDAGGQMLSLQSKKRTKIEARPKTHSAVCNLLIFVATFQKLFGRPAVQAMLQHKVLYIKEKIFI